MDGDAFQVACLSWGPSLGLTTLVAACFCGIRCGWDEVSFSAHSRMHACAPHRHLHPRSTRPSTSRRSPHGSAHRRVLTCMHARMEWPYISTVPPLQGVFVEDGKGGSGPPRVQARRASAQSKAYERRRRMEPMHACMSVTTRSRVLPFLLWKALLASKISH